MLNELWSDLRYRVRALMHRDAVERELSMELHFHLEQEAAKYVRAGLSPDEAMYRARLAFGGVEAAKELSRDARGTRTLESFAQDARYAVRSLSKTPAFTLAVVLTLGLGIAANTAVFTLLDALLLRPLPVPHADQLVTIGDPSKVDWNWHGSPMVDYVSYPLYKEVRDGNTVLSGVYASGSGPDLDVVIPGAASGAEQPNGRLVSSNFFQVLEVPAAIGRTFETGSPSSEEQPVAVISDGYWRRRFAGDRSIIGRTVSINHVPITIIGVTPPGFTGDIVGAQTDMWLPIGLVSQLAPKLSLSTDRTWSWLSMMGRLKPGVTIAQARAQITTLEARAIRSHLSARELVDFDQDIINDPVRVESGVRGFSSQRRVYAAALTVLMVAVSIVVLVICANVTNLMFARSVSRSRELAMRMTLGAGRRRLIAQLLTESVVLAGAAAALGALLAAWAARFLLATATVNDAPVALDVGLNWRILGYTAGTAMACAIFFGVLPALRATRVDLAQALRASGRSVLGGRARLGRGLVISQIALATLLVMGSGLLVRSMRQLLTADLGMDRDHLANINLSAEKVKLAGPRFAALRDQVVARLRAMPGVVDASYTQEGIFSGGVSLGHVNIAGVVTELDSTSSIEYDEVGPRFLHTLGAQILRGRDFEAHDVDSGVNSAVIDATMANAYFAHSDPIGRFITLDSVTYTVVGVVRDVQEHDVRGTPVRRMYFARGTPRPSYRIIIRTQGDPASYVTPIRDALDGVAKGLPTEISLLRDRIRNSVRQDLLVTKVTGFFGLATLLLAAIGLYGVTSYSISQRTSEFGIRMALGAERGRVMSLVLREAVGAAAAGVVVGIAISFATTRLIRGELFGVSSTDLPSMAAAVVVLLATALVAGWLPAMRAGRVGPLEALRAD